jgi:hypothetical protein
VDARRCRRWGRAWADGQEASMPDRGAGGARESRISSTLRASVGRKALVPARVIPADANRRAAGGPPPG